MPTILEDRIHARTPASAWRAGLVVQRIALVAAIVGVWWLVSLTMPHYVLPGPLLVARALYNDWPILFRALRVTLDITFSALARNLSILYRS